MEMAQAMTKPLFDGGEADNSWGQAYFIDHKSRKSVDCALRHWGNFVCSLQFFFFSFFLADFHFEQDSPGYSFSFLLHTVSINNLMTCPNELCKKRNPIYRTLLNIPKAVSIGLTW